jgi:hypothetical protein
VGIHFIMLKLLHTSILLFAALLPLVVSDLSPGSAQEREGCFMVGPSGSLTDLSDICPPPARLQTSGTPQLGTGDIQVTLRWATTDDLDLGVVDPRGDKVTFFNPRVRSGGQLDVDANSGCRSTTEAPLEHIFWPPSQAPQGNYRVEVNLFDRCQGADTVPFTVTLLVRGKTQTFTGNVSTQNPIARFPFTIPLEASSPAGAARPATPRPSSTRQE